MHFEHPTASKRHGTARGIARRTISILNVRICRRDDENHCLTCLRLVSAFHYLTHKLQGAANVYFAPGHRSRPLHIYHLLKEVHLIIRGLFYALKAIVELFEFRVRGQVSYKRGLSIVANQTDSCLVLHPLADRQVTEYAGQCTDCLKKFDNSETEIRDLHSKGRIAPCLPMCRQQQ